MHENSLSRRIAIVTGGGRGIGREIALTLGAEGASVAVVDIDHELAHDTAALSAARHQSAISVTADVGDRPSVLAAFETIRRELGPPEILVNNAGIYKSSALTDVAPDDWLKIINVNLTGAFWCSQAIAPDLIARKAGRIVNVASIGGKIGWPRNHAYCASKSGLLGLTRALALELAIHNVTVNAVCPGNADTEMMRLVDEDVCRDHNWAPGEFVAQTRQRIPLQRLATPADIASTVAFICSDRAAFITGQAINVDGGLVMY